MYTCICYSYKRATKTDVKCSWIKHPKSAGPKTTMTMQELYPSNQPNYRSLLQNCYHGYQYLSKLCIFKDNSYFVKDKNVGLQFCVMINERKQNYLSLHDFPI